MNSLINEQIDDLNLYELRKIFSLIYEDKKGNFSKDVEDSLYLWRFYTAETGQINDNYLYGFLRKAQIFGLIIKIKSSKRNYYSTYKLEFEKIKEFIGV